jgi:sugar-specific transcriptional regulator TrmB
MEQETMRKLGLSEGEIKVYEVLLHRGNSPINSIHESTGIERRNIYDILNKLIERGLVTYISENGRRTFNISHPNKLINYVEEKESELVKLKEEISKELPPLVKQFNTRRAIPSVEVYRGEEGIKATWEDSLNYPELYWIGAGRYIPKQMPNWFNYWNKKRIKKKVYWHNLLRWELKEETKVMPFEEIKFLPEEFSKNPTVTGIYGDNTIYVWAKKNFYFTVLIKDKELAENNKAYHKYLWENIAVKQ